MYKSICGLPLNSVVGWYFWQMWSAGSKYANMPTYNGPGEGVARRGGCPGHSETRGQRMDIRQ